MSELVNMSLDEIIRQSSNRGGRGRGGRGRGRGRGRGGAGWTADGGARSRSRSRAPSQARSRSRSRARSQSRTRLQSRGRGRPQLRGRPQSRGHPLSRGRSQSRSRSQSQGRSQSRGRSRSRSRSQLTPRGRVGQEENIPRVPILRRLNTANRRGGLQNGLTTRGLRKRLGVNTASLRSNYRYSNVGLRSDRILAQQVHQQRRLSLRDDLIPSQVFTRSRSRSRSRGPPASQLTVSVRNDLRTVPQRRNSAVYLDGDALQHLESFSPAGPVRSRRSSAMSTSSAGSGRRGRARGGGGRGGRGGRVQQVLNPSLQLQIAAIQRRRGDEEAEPLGLSFRPVPAVTATTLHQRFACI